MTATRHRSYGIAAWLGVALQTLLPLRLSCALIHRIARSRNRVVKNALIRWFSRRYAIDTSEAALAGHDDYPTFNAFFTRALKDGARPIDAGAHSIVSPADGRLTEFGDIVDGTLLQAKGLHYTISELLGTVGDEPLGHMGDKPLGHASPNDGNASGDRRPYAGHGAVLGHAGRNDGNVPPGAPGDSWRSDAPLGHAAPNHGNAPGDRRPHARHGAVPGHAGRNDGNLPDGAVGGRRRPGESLIEHGADVAPFVGGTFATVYLAPRDYHRVHAPVAGRLVSTHYIPGRRFAVNELTASAVDKLFCRNERVVCRFEGEFGQAAVVLVGALNVSSISTARLGEIASGARRGWAEPEPVACARGEELGRFNLGSTVIIVFSRGAAVWDEALVRGQTLRMGMRIGALTPAGGS